MAVAAWALVVRPLVPAVITVEGPCTLVDAIHAANMNAPFGGCPAGSGFRDTIVLTADVSLNAVAEVDEGDNGLPTISSPIIIEGHGFTVERAPDAVEEFRLAKITGELMLKNTTVTGGSEVIGGAFLNRAFFYVEDSVLIFNHADALGGAIYSEGGLYAYGAVFSSNTAFGLSELVGGGAVVNLNFFRAEDSTFHANSAGGIYSVPSYGYGGAVWNYSGTAQIFRSTFSSNNVHGSSVQRGSAIHDVGTLTLTNSTVSGNGGSTASAGALSSNGAQLTNVTLSGNNNFALVAHSGGTIDVNGSLVANTSGPNCSGIFTQLNSAADDITCSPIPLGVDGLDPVLKDNGGPTETHALEAGSNAIDGAGSCGLPTDQRGAPHVGACDRGSFEYMGCPILVLEDDTVDSVEEHEECAISVGPNLSVVGPGGDLSLIFGSYCELDDGVSVEGGARLTIEHDPSLQLLDPVLIEADRARRRALPRRDESNSGRQGAGSGVRRR